LISIKFDSNQISTTPVQLGLYGFVKLSNVENVLDKQRKLIQKHNNSATPEVVAPPPMVDVTTLSPEMAKYAEFMVPDPEVAAPPPVETNTFTPTRPIYMKVECEDSF